MKVNKFEELIIWQQARKLVNIIYQYSNKSKLSKDYGLKDQIQRAAVSIMSNIAEGFENQSNAEFIKYLYYSKGSAAEVKSLSYVLLDNNFLKKEEFESILCLTDELIKKIQSFITYLRKNKTIKPLNR